MSDDKCLLNGRRQQVLSRELGSGVMKRFSLSDLSLKQGEGKGREWRRWLSHLGNLPVLQSQVRLETWREDALGVEERLGARGTAKRRDVGQKVPDREP